MIKDRYDVVPIDHKIAINLVVKNHYLHRPCPVSKAFALIEKGGWKVYGIVTYGVPCSSTLLKGICGESEMHNVYELNRLWVSDEVPKNGESYLVGNSIKMLDKEIIVSFADTSQNHIGFIYQATNFLYCGLSAKFKDPKVKGMETQHHSTYANRMTNKQVEEKFGKDNVYYEERSRKHRYVYFNANRKRRKELRNKLRYKVLPYPKKNENVVYKGANKPPGQVQLSVFDL